MKIKPVLSVLSSLLIILAILLLIPAAVSLFYGERWPAEYFLYTALGTFLTGIFAYLAFYKSRLDPIGLKEGFLLVTASWVLCSLIGAIPFHVSGYFTSFVAAFFESTSGFTTTGASVLSDVEILPRGLLFWRDFIHWIGGMGIIVLAVAILPQLSVGGMQLLKNEMPGPRVDQLKPRIRQTALSLWKTYVLISILHVIALYALGMPLFESVCHMFGSIATGGFSVKNASIGAYSPAIQYTVAFFMFVGGTNFVLHYGLFRHGSIKKYLQDSEWRFYAAGVALAFLLVTGNLIVQQHHVFETALRHAVFQVISIVTCTGYATTDFDLWPHFSKGLLFLLMFIGGCAGSTSGGIKQVRVLMLLKMQLKEIQQYIHPKAILNIRINRRNVGGDSARGVQSFFLLWIFVYITAVIILLACNIDFSTAASSVIACMSTVGPGFNAVGPMTNYGHLPEVVKLVLTACMLIGRLEIFTVLVLFVPLTWRK